METFAKGFLLLVALALVLNVGGVGGAGAARSPAEAWARVKAWLSAKLIGQG